MIPGDDKHHHSTARAHLAADEVHHRHELVRAVERRGFLYVECTCLAQLAYSLGELPGKPLNPDGATSAAFPGARDAIDRGVDEERLADTPIEPLTQGRLGDLTDAAKREAGTRPRRKRQ